MDSSDPQGWSTTEYKFIIQDGDDDDSDSFHAPAPAPKPAPAPAASSRPNVHFGIGALEAADEPEPVDESYGDDAFEVSGGENFEDDFEDESFEIVEEGSISISAEEVSAPAPAPARSNVHFGVAALEMPDEVPEPAPAPRRAAAAAAPAPAPKLGGGNVHFGIAGLEEMSDDAVAEESVASGSNSNAVSISMDSLQVRPSKTKRSLHTQPHRCARARVFWL